MGQHELAQESMICQVIICDVLKVYSDREKTEVVDYIPQGQLIDVKCFRLSMAELADGRWASSVFLQKVETNAQK